LDVLYGNLGIGKLQYLIKANIDFISGVFIFFLQIFGHQNLESLLTKKCWVRSVSRSSLKPMRIRNTDIIKHIFLHEAAMGYLYSICYLLPFFSAIEPHLVSFLFCVQTEYILLEIIRKSLNIWSQCSCITQLHFLN
jgi:hypothetical protein